MTENERDQLPVWQPGDAVPAWAAKLQEDFPAAKIGYLPQVWCPKCRNHQQKYCGMKADERGSGGYDHILAKCKTCGNKLSTAHFHKSYVGHAHATERLLATDPRWTWRPMGRDIPDAVLIAAIETGDLAVIQTVINAYPPKIVELDGGGGRVERVMWGELIVHDENGNEVVTPGVGDAIGKPWGPNAVKEMIGDLLRNAGQRRGLALALWMKETEEQHEAEKRNADPEGYAARAAMFDDESSQAPPPARTRGPKPRETPPDTGAQAGLNPKAQPAADLAWQLRQKEGMTPAEFRAKVYEPARKDQLLGLHCMAPWDKTQETTVLKVMARCREELESDQDA